jgi:NAD(P)-dependent dehydrogenase (short-subunit alcohol dehydrogenase family)
MQFDFNAKTAIVTGAASGIGAAIARDLAKFGATVILADTNYDGMASVASEIEVSGGTCLTHVTDTSDAAQVQALVAFAAKQTGGLTKVAAMEYATAGVRVNSVGPGFIATPLLEKHLDEDALAGIATLHPIARLGDAAEVSALTCFLLSKHASFITGSYHLVDGGYTAQ